MCIRHCYQILDLMGKATLDIFRQLDKRGMDLNGAIKMLKNKLKELQNCLCNLLVRYQEESAFKKLITLNRSKVHGPGGILVWVFKENAAVLAMPILDFLNSPFHEGCLSP